LNTKPRVDDDQCTRIVKLLEAAQALAHDLQGNELAYLIGRALEQCYACHVPPRCQASRLLG
jgi:hypothetical protein